MTTSNSNQTISSTNTDIKAQYNEYVVDTKEQGKKPMSFAQFSKQNGDTNMTTKTEKEVKETVVSKSSIARAIFLEEKPKGTARKDILARFESEAGLTKAGAATYFANYSAAVKQGKLKLPTVSTEVEEIQSEDLEAAAELHDAIVDATAVSEEEVGDELSLDTVAA